MVCVAALVSVAGAQSSAGSRISKQQMQEAYTRYFSKIRQMLPPHSALPPLMDLTKSKIDDSGNDRAWEKEYTLSVREGGIVDPGVHNASDAMSIATTFLDTAGRPDALPARGCEGVIMGEPIASAVRISPDRNFVYSRFSVQISSVLKGNKNAELQKGAVVTAVQFGGSLRFPSGHLTTFILAQQGFIELNKQYVLFIWRPPESRKTYMVAEAYLVENGLVFPVSTDADVSAYEKGMPSDKFEARVRSAIKKNIDTN